MNNQPDNPPENQEAKILAEIYKYILSDEWGKPEEEKKEGSKNDS